jgi:CBS domain-containing protein
MRAQTLLFFQSHFDISHGQRDQRRVYRLYNTASRGWMMYRFLECKAGQYLSPAVTTVTRRLTMRELEALFRKHDFNGFPVVEDGKLLGIVTKTDILRAFSFSADQMVPHYDELMSKTVSDVMTKEVEHVEPMTPLTRVLQLMVTHRIHSFPVVGSDNQLLGMISREDVMRALQQTTRLVEMV